MNMHRCKMFEHEQWTHSFIIAVSPRQFHFPESAVFILFFLSFIHSSFIPLEKNKIYKAVKTVWWFTNEKWFSQHTHTHTHIIYIYAWHAYMVRSSQTVFILCPAEYTHSLPLLSWTSIKLVRYTQTHKTHNYIACSHLFSFISIFPCVFTLLPCAVVTMQFFFEM